MVMRMVSSYELPVSVSLRGISNLGYLSIKDANEEDKTNVTDKNKTAIIPNTPEPSH